MLLVDMDYNGKNSQIHSYCHFNFTLMIYTVTQCISLVTVRSIMLPSKHIIQLSPEGEVNSGGCIPRREASRFISRAVHRPCGRIVVLAIYHISWIKK